MLRDTAQPDRFVLTTPEGAEAFHLQVSVSPELPFEAQAVPSEGLLSELTVRLPGVTGPRLDQVQITVAPTSTAASCLARQARLLLLGGFEVAGRGAVELGAVLDECEGRATLEGLGVVLQGKGEALLVGGGHLNGDFASLSISEGGLTLTLAPGRTLAQDEAFRVVVGCGGSAAELLFDYGAALGRHARPRREIPTGWNSWDYYQGGITMEACRAEMAAIAASPLRGNLKYFVIDMGWENCWGDWRPNRKFPTDAATIAAEIKAAGFVPGIWLAPLQANTYVPWLRGERDCFCRDADGDPIVAEGRGACLLFDPTHPRTVQLLWDTCAGLREAGFELFKVDYLYRSYFDSMTTLHDPTVGKAAAARRFLEIIRGAIGDDAHLLSCGAPLPCALGLADSVRVSTDIHNFWGHVRNAAGQIATSQWLNGRAWVNDPDFALIRCRDTSADRYLNPPHSRRPYGDPKDFWMAGEDATCGELRTWLNLVHLCGGSLFASDSIARLNETGLGMLARLVDDPAPAPAVPLDLMTAAPPRLWLATDGDRSRLGVFNWEDEPAEIELPGNVPSVGTEYWSGERVSLGPSVRLDGRSSLLVTF